MRSKSKARKLTQDGRTSSASVTISATTTANTHQDPDLHGDDDLQHELDDGDLQHDPDPQQGHPRPRDEAAATAAATTDGDRPAMKKTLFPSSSSSSSSSSSATAAPPHSSSSSSPPPSTFCHLPPPPLPSTSTTPHFLSFPIVPVLEEGEGERHKEKELDLSRPAALPGSSSSAESASRSQMMMTTSQEIMKVGDAQLYLEEDMPVPEEVEIRESSVGAGMGVWTRTVIPCMQKMGPFAGVLRPSVDDPSCAWEIVDRCGKVLGWTDASEPGTGNWMKYVRSSEDITQRNVMAVQVDEQVFYKAVRDMQPSEEMLLYARDALYPEIELETMAMHRLADENQTYPCGDCGEILKSKVARRRHQTYACPKTQSYLARMTLHHDRAIEKTVDSDGKSMDSENSGVEQESGLEGEFKCDQCPKSFQWKSNLVRHQVTHDEDRRYPCENCDKVFTDPSNLQRHIRSQHVGARCHACDQCGKTFATSSGLKQHQHIHSSIKPFQCEAYTQFSNLCRHKRMHADCRQQIKCKDCGQAFSTVTSLSKHKRFCEGALRSGMRLCYSQDKLTPMALSPGTQHPPGFSPAYLYGPRPFHPFFPPLGGAAFPILQPSLPPGLLGPASISPSTMSLAASGLMSDAMLGDKRLRSSPTSEDEERGSRPRGDLSDGALAEQEVGSVSEEERDHSPRKIMKREPGEISPTFSRGGEGTNSKPISAQSSPHKFLLKPPSLSSPSSNKKETGSHGSLDVPFDLSVGSSGGSGRENKSPAVSHADRKTPSPKHSPSSAGDVPLDLSVSKKEAPITPKVEACPSPEELSMKSTHVFGKTPVVPEPKYPFPTSLPFPLSHAAAPSFVESMLRLKEDKPLSLSSYQQDLAKFVFPRFPMPPLHGSFPGLHPLSLLRPGLDKALTTPLLKLDKPGGTADPGHPHQPHHPFPFGSPAVSSAASNGPSNKLKERYSCKFCGKIFPRSANLTRHLRTHTGEQPYKCKYCERSFSISSNLQRHVRNIHNKEKPFRCPLCDRSFGQQTNLDRHLKKHEQEGPNVSDSPTAELEQQQPKDDAYYTEIRSFLAKSLDPLTTDHAPQALVAPPPQALAPPLNKDLSDPEDEKHSDLTIVDDVEDEEDELPLSDEADADADIDSAGEELNLVVVGRGDEKQPDVVSSPPVLNNNTSEVKKDSVEVAASSSPQVMNGVAEKEEQVSDSKEGFEVDVASRAPIACST